MGVKPLQAPTLESRSSGGYYDLEARAGGLTVVGEPPVATRAGVDVTQQLQDAGALSEKQFFDSRQGKLITVTQLDVGKIPDGLMPANGLVYAERTATTTQPDGIRLLDSGGKLGADLTVVSPNPVYMQGDYNSQEPHVAAAVLSDALTLLSNDWQDASVAKIGMDDMPRAKTDTTYNFAFVAGNSVSSPGTFQGGLPNFPRFLENWNPTKCNITGSMVCFEPAKVAVAPWQPPGIYYNAPRRFWNFDQQFMKGHLPPYTPMVARVAQNVFWVER
jgi:hypothetical protein